MHVSTILIGYLLFLDLEMSHLNGAGNQTSEDFVKMSYENQLYSQQSFEVLKLFHHECYNTHYAYFSIA